MTATFFFVSSLPHPSKVSVSTFIQPNAKLENLTFVNLSWIEAMTINNLLYDEIWSLLFRRFSFIT